MQKGNALLYWSKVVSLGLVLGIGLQFAQAWTAPLVAPPGGNVAGPITVGSVGQIKAGNLALNSDGVFASALVIAKGDISGPSRLLVDDSAASVYDDATVNSPYSRVNADSFHTSGLGVGQMFIEGRAIDANSWIAIGAGLAGAQTAQDVRIGDNDEIYVDTSTNNVGIGTTTPNQKLSVNGNIETFGSGNGIIFPDGTKQTTAAGGGGSGTVTSLSAGNGITLSPNPIVGAGTISWNHTATQALNMANFDINAAKNVNATAFYYTSDRRFKENIETLDAGTLEKVLQLNGVSFRWKQDGREDIGVIAQDVERVFPELVKTDPTTGFKSVEYGNLVAPLIEAIKEQQREIDSLEARIRLLEGR